MAVSAYELISTQTLGTAVASVTLSSISQTYTDLVLIVNGVINSGESAIFCQVGNGSVDTGTNYSTTYILGDGSNAVSGRESTQTNTFLGRIQADPYNSTSIIHYMNYANTTTYKTFLGKGSDATYAIQQVGLWRSTSAINTIKLSLVSTFTFSTGTTFTLYGIKAA